MNKSIGLNKEYISKLSVIPNLQQLSIFEQGWPGNDTVCGWGSTMENTVMVREYLPYIIKAFNIQTINDAGCGDLFWLRTLDLTGVDYVGYDIFERSTWPELIQKGWNLQIADVTKDIFRPCDLTICRDVFIHLPNDLVLSALEMLKSTSKYLFITNFTSHEDGKPVNNNKRIVNASIKHSKIDLRKEPFNLGPPLFIIPENYDFKSTSLWKIK